MPRTDPSPLRAVTIADVARAAQVSPATVSRVLNGHPRVDPQLAERVHQAAAAANYVPNGVGRALRRQRSDMWAAIIPDVHNAFFTRVVEAFEGVANADGYSVVLCNSREDSAREQEYIATAIAHQVSGVLLAPTSVNTSVAALERAGIPVVTIDRRVRDFSGDRVTVDGQMIGQLAADHMVEQGCRAPLVVTGPSDVTSTTHREHGFLATMAEMMIDVPEERVLRADLLAEDAQQLVGEALERFSEVDGVFAVNGPITSATFLALRDHHRSVPEDVILVGVDDDHWTRMVTPAVTVVAQPVAQIGRWAGQLLLARSRQPPLDYAKITLDPTLVVRQSSVRHPTKKKAEKQ